MILNNLNYLREKQSALIIARRTATPAEQQEINVELEYIYDAIYRILKEKKQMKELKNHIKKNTNTLKIKTKVDFNGGIIPKSTVLAVKREIGFGWFGGGYQWSLEVLRNAELVEILKQVG
jgi:hypothetical protein